MMQRRLLTGVVLALFGGCVPSETAQQPCVVRRPSHITTGVVAPNIAELRPMLGDATRLVEPSLEESAAGRRLRNRLRRLSQSLDSGSADARCRALNASLRSFARLERSPGATRELNALALVLDLTALALLDSMPPAAAALNPSRSNSQGGAR